MRKEIAEACQSDLLELGFDEVTLIKGHNRTSWQVKLEGSFVPNETEKILDLMASMKPMPKMGIYSGPEVILE